VAREGCEGKSAGISIPCELGRGEKFLKGWLIFLAAVVVSDRHVEGHNETILSSNASIPCCPSQ